MSKSYLDKETFTAKLFYLDYLYSFQTAMQVQEILKQNGFFSDCYIRAGKLTKNRLQKYKPEMESFLPKAYEAKDTAVLQIVEERNSDDCWRIDWPLMCPKTDVQPEEIHIWNVFSISVPHRLLKRAEFQNRYMKCFRDLISVLHPFYGQINDLSVSVALSTPQGKTYVVPTQYGIVKAIHWGNYFSKEYCEKYGISIQTELPVEHKTVIADGVFFTLTESPLEYASALCKERRKLIENTLNISLTKIAESLDYKGLPPL